MKKAVVLLSGGLDSATMLAMAKNEGYELYALTFDYGQRHNKEVESSKMIGQRYGVKEHKVLRIDMNQIGGSALTDNSLELPSNRNLESGEIPITYVPARNMILLGFAVAWAEVLNADAIYIGANTVDFSGYPDCKEEFFEAFENAAKLGTKSGVEGHKIEIKYPLIALSKAEIIKKGMELNVPYELTWSCYSGEDKACGKCDACVLRLKGFTEVGVKDTIEYK